MNIRRPLSPHLPIYKPQLTSTFSISHRISGAFLATIVIVFLFYLLCLKIGLSEFFQALLERVGFSVGRRSLALFCSRAFGWEGGLALAVAWSLKFLFITDSCNMMAPSGASGSGSGESAGGRGFRWTDLFGSSSPANSEASLDQPAPDSPNPGEPAAPIAEVYHPLQEDEQRRRELSDRLRLNTIKHPLPEEIFEEIIETQFQTELKIEKALRSDRVQEDSILEKRHQIRGALFYYKGRPLSLETYLEHLNQIEKQGTHRSPPYKELMKAIFQKMEFKLDFEGIKKRKYW